MPRKKKSYLYSCPTCNYSEVNTAPITCPNDGRELVKHAAKRIPKLPKREHGSANAIPDTSPFKLHGNHLLPTSEYAHFETSQEAFLTLDEACGAFDTQCVPGFKALLKQLRKRGGYARLGLFIEWAPDKNAPAPKKSITKTGF